MAGITKARSGSRKHGRNKRKSLNRNSPASLYARNKISFETYSRLTGVRAGK